MIVTRLRCMCVLQSLEKVVVHGMAMYFEEGVLDT